MKDIRNINFNDLSRRFYDGTSAREAIDWYKSHKEDAKLMRKVLRNHVVAPIRSSEEIRIRDAVDSLLTYYSYLEIAHIADFVPEQVDGVFYDDAREVLDNPIVAEYYCEFYPLILPQLFFARIDKRFSARRCEHRESISLFLEMLEVCRPMHEDGDINSFLRCLDDYTLSMDGKTILSMNLIVRAIQEPAEYVERLTRPASEREPLDEALAGFVKFLSFSLSFHALLERMGDLPLLQSACWHCQSYWFWNLRKKAHEAVDNAIRQYNEWESFFECEDDSFEATRLSIDSVRKVVGELYSDRFKLNLLAEARGQRVEVYGNEISKAIVKAPDELETDDYGKVTELDLSGPGVTESSILRRLKNLEGLKNLEVLKLSNNQLTEVPKEIVELASLREITLGGNEIPQDEVERIERVVKGRGD